MITSNIKIRNASGNDIPAITELFYNCINNICIKEYTKDQIQIWANQAKNDAIWEFKIQKDFFIVVEIDSEIVGFGSLEPEGCVDLLYVHHGYQNRGIASKIIATIENEAKDKGLLKVWTDSSSIALPFFLKKNYQIERKYEKKVQGILFSNTILSKTLT